MNTSEAVPLTHDEERRVMFNRIKPLVLYTSPRGEYRAYRVKTADLEIQRKTPFRIGDGTMEWWKPLTTLQSYRTKWWLSPTSEKRKINKMWAEKAESFIKRWKLLLSGGMWEVRCHNWDGQGTPCPMIRKMEDGTDGCPVKFSWHGYGGCYPPARKAPGICDSRINTSYSLNICLPTNEDEHGFSFYHLVQIRHEIYRRGDKA